ncbi:MAG TPA: hypothetical protein VLH15_03035 [Dehalococcoidales bacterium]|nr:hypothetical protein [Dehalococcoidales bacterium]
MANLKNLNMKMKEVLPSETFDFLAMAGRVGLQMGYSLFLVGGTVRDLILGRPNLDIDLTVEGDAARLAGELALAHGEEVIAHPRFGTARFKWKRCNVDIASAREESYQQPGQLPTVDGPSDIRGDLRRRDFTINALAIDLRPEYFGTFIDVFNGHKDLKAGKIRVLHEKSFQDDATRLWRAVRYEQRFGFRIEPWTFGLVKRDIACLDSISPDRLRSELELCLAEEQPEKVFSRASELGLCQRLSPAWQVTPRIFKNLVKIRTLMQPYFPPPEIYLAVLFDGIDSRELRHLINRLKLSRSAALILQDSLALKNILPTLSQADLKNSQIFILLQTLDTGALVANRVILDSVPVQARIELFLNHLRYVKPELTGDDLIRAGIPSGPLIGEILEILREAKLDGKLSTREEELALAKIIARQTHRPAGPE